MNNFWTNLDEAKQKHPIGKRYKLDNSYGNCPDHDGETIRIYGHGMKHGKVFVFGEVEGTNIKLSIDSKGICWRD